MKIIFNTISKEEILEKHNNFFKTVIKAVVDIKKEIIALDAELHADLEGLLLENNSQQENLWGINLYLDKEKKDWIEYTALINIRPSMGNNGMEVEDKEVKEEIEKIVYKLIEANGK